VADLLLSCITERLLGDCKRRVGVARDVEIEDLRFVWGRGSERADDEECSDWLRGGEELVGKVLVSLDTLARFHFRN